MKQLIIRGIIMLILGILTLSLVGMYVYYYATNELLTTRNKSKYRLFGPTPILIMLIIINIFTLIYCLFLTLTYTNTTFDNDQLSYLIEEKCIGYEGLSSAVKRKVSHKIFKHKS